MLPQIPLTDLETIIKDGYANNNTTYCFEEAIQLYLSDPKVAHEVNAVYPVAALIPAIQGREENVLFGKYAQQENGAVEPIEWHVVVREKERMLLISRYALDCQPFDELDTTSTWETCSLREWLNDSFLNEAFSTEEREVIPCVKIRADEGQSSHTNAEEITWDQVFLLSTSQVNKYLINNRDRQCQGTSYCFAQGAQKRENNNCWWWLRNPGIYVRTNGTIADFGRSTNATVMAVRPALWVNLGS